MPLHVKKRGKITLNLASNYTMLQGKLRNIFGRDEAAKDARAVQIMNDEIRKVGGVLRFKVHKDADGWTAECVEIEGILTGGKNPNPSDDEINHNVQEAIRTTFNVETSKTVKVYNSEQVTALYTVAGGERVAA